MSDLQNDASASGFVAHWARVGPLLDKLNQQEQSKLTEEEHLQAVANVLQLAKPDSIPNKTSGLIEQHRLFQRPS